jgi:hypothetical protein
MPPAGWANAEESSFLTSMLPEFLDAQKTKRFDRFWPRFFDSWFEKFSERERLFPGVPEPLSDEQMAQLQDAITKREKVRCDPLSLLKITYSYC